MTEFLGELSLLFQHYVNMHIENVCEHTCITKCKCMCSFASLCALYCVYVCVFVLDWVCGVLYGSLIAAAFNGFRKPMLHIRPSLINPLSLPPSLQLYLLYFTLVCSLVLIMDSKLSLWSWQCNSFSPKQDTDFRLWAGILLQCWTVVRWKWENLCVKVWYLVRFHWSALVEELLNIHRGCSLSMGKGTGC